LKLRLDHYHITCVTFSHGPHNQDRKIYDVDTHQWELQRLSGCGDTPCREIGSTSDTAIDMMIVSVRVAWNQVPSTVVSAWSIEWRQSKASRHVLRDPSRYASSGRQHQYGPIHWCALFGLLVMHDMCLLSLQRMVCVPSIYYTKFNSHRTPTEPSRKEIMISNPIRKQIPKYSQCHTHRTPSERRRLPQAPLVVDLFLRLR
jgi:hypothetical protein